MAYSPRARYGHAAVIDALRDGATTAGRCDFEGPKAPAAGSSTGFVYPGKRVTLPATPVAETDFCEVSIVVPTINEAENLPMLIKRIGTVMANAVYEVLIIDDGSQDGTVEVCRELGRSHPLMLHVRQQPIGGLSGAVLHGFSQARGAILVVMDGDLQHPPEMLPSVLAPLQAGEADFVIGSRHAPSGRIVGQWGLARRLSSGIATMLTASLAGAVRDPMSGFFALHRTTWQHAPTLHPIGYKIGLELMCKCQFKRIIEVPIDFGLRTRGSSKFGCWPTIDFLRHLLRLYAHVIAKADT